MRRRRSLRPARRERRGQNDDAPHALHDSRAHLRNRNHHGPRRGFGSAGRPEEPRVLFRNHGPLSETDGPRNHRFFRADQSVSGRPGRRARGVLDPALRHREIRWSPGRKTVVGNEAEGFDRAHHRPRPFDSDLRRTHGRTRCPECAGGAGSDQRAAGRRQNDYFFHAHHERSRTLVRSHRDHSRRTHSGFGHSRRTS